jgi:hypothetical protein
VHISRVSLEGAVFGVLEKTNIFEGAGQDLRNPRVSLEGDGRWGLERSNIFEGVGQDLRNPRDSFEGACGWVMIGRRSTNR